MTLPAVSSALSALDKAGNAIGRELQSLLSPVQQNPYGPSSVPVGATSVPTTPWGTLDVDCSTFKQAPLEFAIDGDTLLMDPLSNGWALVWLNQVNGAPLLMRGGQAIRGVPFSRVFVQGSPNQVMNITLPGEITYESPPNTDALGYAYVPKNDTSGVPTSYFPKFCRFRYGKNLQIDFDKKTRRRFMWNYGTTYNWPGAGSFSSPAWKVGNGALIERVRAYVAPSSYPAGVPLSTLVYLSATDDQSNLIEQLFLQPIGNGGYSGQLSSASGSQIILNAPVWSADDWQLPIGATTIQLNVGFSNASSAQSYLVEFNINAI